MRLGPAWQSEAAAHLRRQRHPALGLRAAQRLQVPLPHVQPALPRQAAAAEVVPAVQPDKTAMGSREGR